MADRYWRRHWSVSGQVWMLPVDETLGNKRKINKNFDSKVRHHHDKEHAGVKVTKEVDSGEDEDKKTIAGNEVSDQNFLTLSGNSGKTPLRRRNSNKEVMWFTNVYNITKNVNFSSCIVVFVETSRSPTAHIIHLPAIFHQLMFFIPTNCTQSIHTPSDTRVKLFYQTRVRQIENFHVKTSKIYRYILAILNA